MRIILTIILLILSGSSFLFGLQDIIVEGTEEGSITVTRIAGPFNHPWSIAILPGDEGFLVTERPGSLYLITGDSKISISGLPEISPTGQGGFLDIIADKNFSRNRIVYFTYSQFERGRYGTAVARAELRNNRLNNVRVIFQAGPKSRGGLHFGSRLLQSEEGFLYITLGDRGRMENAQDLEHHGGSVIRIHSDGSIPEDNPFVGSDLGKAEIYTYGHRNPQGIAYSRERNEIWLHEHGPKGGDELNVLTIGANYGWPLITYGINYNGAIISDKTSAPGLEQPITYWVPSIAPSGMAFLDSDARSPWRRNLFIGALVGQHLRRLVLEEDGVVHEEVLLKNKIGRVRDVRTGPDDNLYVITDHDRGYLFRIEPPE